MTMATDPERMKLVDLEDGHVYVVLLDGRPLAVWPTYEASQRHLGRVRTRNDDPYGRRFTMTSLLVKPAAEADVYQLPGPDLVL